MMVAEGETAVLPRLGVSNASGKGFVLCDGREWQMGWNAGHVEADCFVHVPMLAWGTDGFEEVRAGKTANKNGHDYWLVFNECSSSWQCAASPQDAARFYHDVLIPWTEENDPNARLIVGGDNAGKCGIRWLEEFVVFYRSTYGEDVPRAGWHFHPYFDIWAGHDCEKTWEWNWAGTQSTDAILNGWLEQAENTKRFVLQYGREGDEIWYSETSCLAPPPAACHTSTAALASMIIEWMNTEGRYVNRVSWYSDWSSHWWVWSNLYVNDPKTGATQLTAAGDIWLSAELLPVIPLEIHKRYFPILGYGGVTGATPAPMTYPTATPPTGYPVPGDLHP